MKEYFNKTAYCSLLTLCTTIGVLSFVFSFYEFDSYTLFLILFVLITEAFISAVKHLFKKEHLIFFIIALLSILLIVFIFIWEQFSEWFSEYLIWLSDYLNNPSSHTTNTVGASTGFLFGFTEEALGYLLFSIAVPSIVLTLILHALLLKRPVRKLIGLIILVMLPIISITGICDSKVSSVLLIMYILMVLSEIIFVGLYPSGTCSQAYVFRLFPVWIVMTVLLSAIPYSNEPYSWNVVKKIWSTVANAAESVMNSIEIFFSPEKSEFSMSFAGYSDDGNVTGMVANSAGIALHLETASVFPSNIYLSGKYMNHFDGRKWDNDFDSTIINDELDAIELFYSASRMENSDIYFDNMLSTAKYRMIFRNIYTKTLFAPPKLLDMDPLSDTCSYERKDGSLIMNKVYGRDTAFDVRMAVLYPNNQYFAHFAEAQEKYRYSPDRTDTAVKNEEHYESFALSHSRPTFVSSVPENLEYKLYERAENIKQHFLKVPECISPRVRELAENITSGYDSNLQKMAALESFLHTYTYTLTPAVIPEDRELIDYLLFESGEGYCTYYATALAIMARCAGIPTRYVQGFMIPVDSTPSKEYVIYDSYAHAWVEAYIEGIGWMTFEGTPAYNINRTLDKSGDLPDSSNQNDYTVPKPIDPDRYKPVLPSATPMPEDMPDQKPIDYSKLLLLCLIPFGIAILILLTVLIVKLLVKQAFKKKYKASSLEERVILDMVTILKLLATAKLSMEENETINEFLCRTGNSFSELADGLRETTDIFCRIRYGKDTATEDEQAAVVLLRTSVYNTVKHLTKNPIRRISLFLIT